MLTEDGKRVKLARDKEIEQRIKGFKIEQEALLKELESVGVHVDMVNRLPMTPVEEYAQAIPILFRHLKRVDFYSEGTLESIARSLAVKESAIYWDQLVEAYQQQRSRQRTGPGNFVMGLAAAVGVSCPPSRIEELILLLKQSDLPHRVLLLNPLRKRRGKDVHIAMVSEELALDPALSKEINGWKPSKRK